MTQNQSIKFSQRINSVNFSNVRIDLDHGTKYCKASFHHKQKPRCPHCGATGPIYDHRPVQSSWRGLDDGILKVVIQMDLRRITCPDCQKVVTESVPFALPGSRFTKVFEQEIAHSALSMSKTDICKKYRINWRTVGAIITRIREVLEPDPNEKFENLKYIGIDETSYQKGHKYLTTVTNLETNELIWAAPGHDGKTLSRFFEQLKPEQRQSIMCVAGDGARWIKSTVTQYCEQAIFCIDPFHVVSWSIDAMDTVRKDLWKSALSKEKEAPKRGRGRPSKKDPVPTKHSKILNGAKYSLGKNPENLTTKQQTKLDEIKNLYPKMFRAYQIKEALRNVFHCDTIEETEAALNHWMNWARRSQIPTFIDLYYKIKRHKEAILNTTRYGMSTSKVEAMNNKIKVIIRRSYGFGKVENLIDMILLSCSRIGRTLVPAYKKCPGLSS